MIESLDADELRRYGRHLTLSEVGPQGQARLKAARVLLVGAGGLGSPLGLYLAAAGVGTLGLVDDDQVEETNLQRQVLYATADVGRPKTEAAAERLRGLNPRITVKLHPDRLTAENVEELVAGYDMVADGSDNAATRYLVNDACVLAGKPNIWGAVLRFEGQVSVFWGERGPCYRCLFPQPPPLGAIPTCSEAGVLGVLPGIIGGLQANEVLKLILGVGDPLIGRFLTFDALRLRFHELRLERDPICPMCGVENPDRRLLAAGTGDAVECATNLEEEGMSSGEIPFEIEPQQLVSWREDGETHLILDVREPQEYEICHIEGARLVPLRTLPEQLENLEREAIVVVHCHHGPRAIQAVSYLRQQGFERATHLRGGIDAWSLEIDPSVPRY